MSDYEELHRLLADHGDAPPELNDDERWLMSHLGALAAWLPGAADGYRDLLTARDATGVTPDLREAALVAAGELAVLLQSVYRRPVVLAAAEESPVDPSFALGALDHLFYSFTLLTCHPDDEYSESRLTLEELDEFMNAPRMQAWLAEIGAGTR